MRCVRIALVSAISMSLAGPVAAQSGATLKARADMRIDGNTEDLVPVTGVYVSRDGFVALAQAQDATVKLFDRNGKLVSRLGRRGEGPGEFSALGRGGWIGDSLWISDPRLARISFFDTKKFLGSLNTKRTSLDAGLRQKIPPFMMAFPAALSADHAYIALMTSPQGPLASRYSEPVYGYLDSNGVVKNIILAMPPSPDGFDVRKRGVGAVYMSQPFKRKAMEGVAPDGSRVALVQAIIDGKDKGTFSALMVSHRGDTIYNRSHRFRTTPLPRSVGDSAMKADLREISRRPFAAGELAAEYRRRVAIPDVYPPFTHILVGLDNSLWIGLRETQQGTPYLVLDQKGNQVGVVTFPRRTRVGAARIDTAWVTEMDDDDIESVVRYVVSR